MGKCYSCNAHDSDEVRFIDTKYTPHTTLLSGSPPLRGSKKKSEVKVPVVRRQEVKRATTTHVQIVEILGPLIKEFNSEDGGGAFARSNSPTISNYSETLVQGDIPLHNQESDLQPDFRIESETCCRCPENHQMRRLSTDNLPDEYGHSHNGTRGAPRCDVCSKRNIHMEAYYHCSRCDYDICEDCAGIAKQGTKRHGGGEEEFFVHAWMARDRMKAALNQSKKRLKRNKKRLETEEKQLLAHFAQSKEDNTLLGCVRQKAFMFLSRAFEVGYEFDNSLLGDIYRFYSKLSEDINDAQMCNLLTECNKAFAQICDDYVKEAKKQNNKSHRNDEVIDNYIEQLEDSAYIYKEKATNISDKEVKRVRKKFKARENGGVVTLRAFVKHIGPAIFEDQMEMTGKWNQVLEAESPRDFFQISYV